MEIVVGCSTCGNKAEHEIVYSSLHKYPVSWKGNYCTICLVKKLRGMATVWDKQRKNLEKLGVA